MWKTKVSQSLKAISASCAILAAACFISAVLSGSDGQKDRYANWFWRSACLSAACTFVWLRLEDDEKQTSWILKEVDGKWLLWMADRREPFRFDSEREAKDWVQNVDSFFRAFND